MGSASASESSALTLAVAGFLRTRRSANTRAAYGADLRHFAAWCAADEPLNLLTVDAAGLARYRTACELAGASPATIARRLSAVTSFQGYAAELGLEPGLDAAATVERPALGPSSPTAALSDGDSAALLAAADEAGARAAVLIRLLMLDGLKVGEAIRADASDVRGRAPNMTLHVDSRDSALVVHPESAVALRRYLGARREGPLLLNEQRGQTEKRLTRFGVDYVIKQIALAAGLEQSVSANTLRRRYVIAAHERGTGLDAIRRQAGHSAPRTTRRYLPPGTPTR